MVIKYLWQLMLLIFLVENGYGMKSVFDNIAVKKMKNIERIFTNMSNEFDIEKDVLSLDRINFYKNRTMAIVKRMDKEISSDNNQQPDVYEFIKYVAERTKNFETDLTNHYKNNFTVTLTNFAKKLEKTQKIECIDNSSPTQFILYRLYYITVSFQVKTFIYEVELYFDNIMRMPQANIHRSHYEKIKNAFQELNILLTENRDEIKSLFHDSIDLRKIDNCGNKKINHRTSFKTQPVSRPIILSDEKYNDNNSGTCESLSQKRNSCKGEVYDCREESKISYCVKEENGTRYYKYIQRTVEQSVPDTLWSKSWPQINIKLYGDENSCPRNKDETFEMLSVSKSDSCSVCVCFCRETEIIKTEENTFIFPSLLVSADIENGKIITGVRFVEKDRVIYTQIKEGKLMPGGWIDNSTDQWKLITEINKTSINNTKNYYHKFIVINKTSDLKSIKIEKLHCPINSVVTGIQFKIKEDKEIFLSITCHYYVWKTGLIVSDERKKSCTNPNGLRWTVVSLILDSTEDRYDKILLPNFNESKTTWFDGQDVASKISLPISAVEIYRKNVSDSGDFIAFRLYSIDYAENGFL